MSDNNNPAEPSVQPQSDKPKQPSALASFIFVLLSVGVVIATGAYVWWQSYSEIGFTDYVINKPYKGQPAGVARSAAVTKFSSEAEFKEWLAKSLAKSESGMYYGGFGGGFREVMAPMAAMDLGLEFAQETGLTADSAAKAAPSGIGAGGPGRVSETNVQVAGLDEPDIVKTDGKEIYFSPERRYWYWDEWARVSPSSGIKSQPNIPTIKNFKAWPPTELALEGKVDDLGELLLYENTLVVLSDSGLTGYDVTDPTAPSKSWSWQQEDGVYLVTARLMDGQIYLVTRNSLNYDRPCPIPLYSLEGGATVEGEGVGISLPCAQIWHPVYPYPSDVTYAVSVIDAATGKAGDSTAFVGSAQDSIVYMSPDSLYLATGRDGDALEFFLAFLNENTDLAPAWVTNQLAKVANYDISDAAKFTELEQVMSRWQNSLSSDDRLKLMNEMENRLGDYYKEHRREWESTNIVKVTLTDMSVAANGSVPGRLLNQFSMDELDGNLRVATTVGTRGAMTWRFGFDSSSLSASDVYVLDSRLETLGSAKDLGEGERIYSVRFLGNRGYVVTFKETDPFYVLDLSQPTAPEVKGELKIPGYSSYLHPIGSDKVLGIGKEGSQVKLSLFGVADAANPTELAKYTLDEYWSDVLNTHHAFLLDDRHEAFFLPGGKGGYVFYYRGGSLSMARALGNIQAKRAIYIDDYLYIIGEDKLVVLDEATWDEVNRLDHSRGLTE